MRIISTLIIAAAFAAVSYTHLDVYQRQVDHCRLEDDCQE